jgi:hypothetical protein
MCDVRGTANAAVYYVSESAKERVLERCWILFSAADPDKVATSTTQILFRVVFHPFSYSHAALNAVPVNAAGASFCGLAMHQVQQQRYCSARAPQAFGQPSERFHWRVGV